MSNKFQIISISGQSDQIIQINDALKECGFKTKFNSFPISYNFNIDNISTIIVTLIGTGGINAILSNIIQHYKKNIKVKIENGKISELEIESSMKKTELENLIKEIKQAFENN